LKPLADVTVSVRSASPAAAVCARHLERLGATVNDPPAAAPDVLLTDSADDADARIVCVFEQHRLDGGDLVASEATAEAVLGYGDYVSGQGEHKARLGSDIGMAVTGVCATQAVLAQRLADAPSAVVRVSPLRSLSTLKSLLWAARSRPDEWSGTHVTSRDRAVDSGYRVADGHVTIDFSPWGQDSWEQFVERLELPSAAAERLRPRWYETVGWGDDVDLGRPLYEAMLGALSMTAAQDLVRACGGSSVPFLTLDECLAHPQASAVEVRERAVDGLPWRSRRSGESPGRPVEGDPSRPLAGVRVVDFGVGGVGPFSATLLAWLGADVVKVEAPNEFIMTVRPYVGGVSSTYLAINQGKRSVELDLKAPSDHELARRLVAGADVLLENFRPGAMNRLGLGFEEVAALNPAIVYCSATGFGWAGPLAEQPCTDPHMQAFSGFAWGNADGGRPRRIRYYGFVDLVTSCTIAEAICAALLERSYAGGAFRLETSMLHAAVAAQLAVQPAPFDDLLPTGDGAVAITCRSEAESRLLADALGGAAPADAVAGAPAAAWVARLARQGLPCARAISDDDAMARADLWRLGVLRELVLPHAPSLVTGGPPWDLGGPLAPIEAPLPGDATDALRERPERFWSASPA
jgi:crotonobetainyl-CoA:carnitine CoA-transferase CaiB-like acyl-CoA transferase